MNKKTHIDCNKQTYSMNKQNAKICILDGSCQVSQFRVKIGRFFFRKANLLEQFSIFDNALYTPTRRLLHKRICLKYIQ